MSEAEQAAARSIKAYFQLLADVSNAWGVSYQTLADQVTPENILRFDGQNGLISAATNSLTKAGEMLPQAYARYWKTL